MNSSALNAAALNFFKPENPSPRVIDSEWGTFKDSARAPVHRWFAYPAGFSYKAVLCDLDWRGIIPGMTVYDPFAGTGTTNLAAKSRGIESIGIEAHPFVHRIAQVKLNWSVSEKAVVAGLSQIAALTKKTNGRDIDACPLLLHKCYDRQTLCELLAIRDATREIESRPARHFLQLALTAALRRASNVGTGWPYIAPNKIRKKAVDSAPAIFENQAAIMLDDLRLTRTQSPGWRRVKARVIFGDARDTGGHLAADSVDHVFTSPPYLNNYDYGDRTRLEMYFMGEAQNWGDITRAVRNRLITAATTQILSRGDARYRVSSGLRARAPAIAAFLEEAAARLALLRREKSGKKSYDHMVIGYFNDIFRVLVDLHRVLKPGNAAVFILGDSAPYGVHIPTDEITGKLALAAGFRGYDITLLRARGDKWRNNPQRHSVKLRESMLAMLK